MPTPYKSTTTTVTVVSWLLSQLYQDYCHSRTKPVVTAVPKLWYGCDNRLGTSVSIAVVTHVPSP